MSAEEREAFRSNAEAKLTDPRFATRAQQALQELDRQIAAEAAALSEHVRSLPMARRVIEAFRREPMTATQQRLVRVLLDHPHSTSEQLTAAMGWDGQTWHMHFGMMCKDREALLWPAEAAIRRDSNFYSGILAIFEDDRWWTIKPEVAEGLAELGIRPAKVGSK